MRSWIARACGGLPVGRHHDTCRAALFPVVPGGEATLQDLVAEYQHSGPTFRRTVQTTLKASYSNHYRRGLVRLLEVLEFRSNNTAHQPVIQALGLIRRHGRDGNTRYYPLGEAVPSHAATARATSPTSS